MPGERETLASNDKKKHPSEEGNPSSSSQPAPAGDVASHETKHGEAHHQQSDNTDGAVLGESTRGELQPWTRRSSEIVYSTRIFDLRRDSNQSPRTAREHDFWVLESGDWVNILPITRAGEVVLIRQWRHGIGDFTLEIPGGMIDPEDVSPLSAARREMVEETGYDSADIVELGAVHPNPAIQGNRLHTFLARDVELLHAPEFDSTEEVTVELVARDRLPALVREGRITHALVVVAFYLDALLRGEIR